jgi:hypothetical protein
MYTYTALRIFIKPRGGEIVGKRNINLQNDK